jgi:hypothetical protein
MKKVVVTNKEIVEGTYYYGNKLPPQINTPSGMKKQVKVRFF